MFRFECGRCLCYNFDMIINHKVPNVTDDFRAFKQMCNQYFQVNWWMCLFRQGCDTWATADKGLYQYAHWHCQHQPSQTSTLIVYFLSQVWHIYCVVFIIESIYKGFREPLNEKKKTNKRCAALYLKILTIHLLSSTWSGLTTPMGKP